MNFLDVAGVLIHLVLVENIQAPIAPSPVKLFSGEKPPEVGSVHSMEPAMSWVVSVRSTLVTTMASTYPPTAFSSAAVTASLGVECGYPAINLALAPSSRPWRGLDCHLDGNVRDGYQPISQNIVKYMCLAHANSKCICYLHYIKHPLNTEMVWDKILVTGERRIRILKIGTVLLA